MKCGKEIELANALISNAGLPYGGGLVVYNTQHPLIYPYTNKKRPNKPIRCDVWSVELMRYRHTNRPTDTAS